MEMDLSDDVSALSMDGASAIAGMAHLKRMRKDFSKMQLGIPEDEEQQQQHQQQRPTSSAPSIPKNLRDSNGEHNKTNGDDLIEPFPKTYEEWKEKKKEKKHKHKSKKHSKKSGSKSGHSRSSSKHSSKHKDNGHEQQQHDQLMENIGEKSSPPIMEISIQSANFPSSDNTPVSPARRSSSQLENGSDVRSYPSIASTAHSSSQNERLQSQHRSSFRSSFQDHSHMQASSSLLREARSADSRDEESMTHMTGHSTHMTGQSAYSAAHSQGTSHVTVEDLQRVRTKLERARAEERQVLEIHERLEGEVRSAQRKAERAREQCANIGVELEAAEAERERMQERLKHLHNENNELRVRVRALEDKEDEEGLDGVLDSMEAKIRALKLKSKRSRERRS